MPKSSDPASLTFYSLGIFSRRSPIFGGLIDMSAAVDRCKISGISRLMAEISEVKHGPSHIANRGNELFRNFDLDLLELLKSDFV